MTDPHTLAAPAPPAAAPLPARLPAAPRSLAGELLPWVLLLAGLALVPVLMGDSDYRMAQFAKYLALAILALGIDLVWGYTGMLTLGQGLYFGLGAYCLAYCLEMQQVAAVAGARPGTVAPGFMNYTNLPVTHPDYHPPWALKYIAPLADTWVALAAAVALPVVVATLFGLVTFRLRIRGVYFALITQALLLAVYRLVLNQQPLTGGFVGIKNLADLKLFGLTFNDGGHATAMYYLSAGVLVACTIACWALVRSKVGKVMTAIRDSENRVLALGYSPAAYKIFVFAFAGALAGIAGALYTAANGLAGPGYLDVTYSIFFVILVAVGGRGTLFGAVLGAVLVSAARDRVSELNFPVRVGGWHVIDFKGAEYWPILIGLLFVVVVLFLPDGIVGGLRKLPARLRRVRAAAVPSQGV
jgi:urea transport system permease protein